MNEDATHPETASRARSFTSGELKDLIAQAQHDLRNPLGNILGFCEMLLKQLPPADDLDLRGALEAIDKSASQMVAAINRVLDPDKVPASPQEVSALQAALRPRAAEIMHIIQRLLAKAAASPEGPPNDDLSRMSESAQRLSNLIETALSIY